MFYERARTLNRSQSHVEMETRPSTHRRLHKAARLAIRNRWAKIIVIALSLGPAGALMWQVVNRNLEASAATFATRQTGDWALTFLILTLAITPLRRLLDLPDLIRFRRALGLFAFFYTCLHVAAWRVFKLGHTLQIGSLTIWSLRIGFVAFVVMLPLAITSTEGWIRRMGGKRWRALHTLAYLSTVAGFVHYCLLPHIGIGKLAAFGVMVVLLLLFRIRTFTMLR